MAGRDQRVSPSGFIDSSNEGPDGGWIESRFKGSEDSGDLVTLVVVTSDPSPPKTDRVALRSDILIIF